MLTYIIGCVNTWLKQTNHLKIRMLRCTSPDKEKSRRPLRLRDFSWLSIKNDYRTLIGADELDLVEKAEDEDDEDSNA